MFAKIISWLKGVMMKMLNVRTDTRISAGAPIAVSPEMAEAIQRWHDEYTGNAYWLTSNRQSLQLPALIASEMATLVTLEAKVTITGSARAEWLTEQLAPVLENLHTNVEYACAMGGIVMKPYPDDGNIAIDYVHVDDFYPVAFNGRREITSAVFVERKRVAEAVYSRVEYHQINGTTYTITNDCYRGYSDDDIGQKVPLTDVDEWSDIEPVATIENMDFPLFAYFRIPLGNSVDPKSPLGVSVFAKAEENIKEADRQYQRLLWEFKGGELAIEASDDMFDMGPDGKPIIPVGMERLYRPNKLDASSSSPGVYNVFSPAMRDESIINGLNEILSKIEDATGLARGTLSDRIKETRTATEIKFSRQKTYATVTAIQTALGKSIESLVRAMDAIATLYGLAPAGTYEVACKWDDSVVTDADTERLRDLQEVRDGLMLPWEYRVKWYGEDKNTAKRMLQEEEEPTDDELLGFGNPKEDKKPNEKQEQQE